MLRYLNFTIISTFFVPLLPVGPVIFSLILNKLVIKQFSKLALAALKSVIASSSSRACSFLQYCRKIPDVLE